MKKSNNRKSRSMNAIKKYLKKRNNSYLKGSKRVKTPHKKIKRKYSIRKVKKGKSVSFNKEKFYCGNKRRSPQGYSRLGSRYECMKKGFGAGGYSERKKLLDYLESS